MSPYLSQVRIMMSEIQRYDLVFNEYLGAGIGLCDTGKYVQYTDHLADHQRIIAEKDAEIKLLRESIEAGTPVAKRRLAEIERLKGLLSVAKCPACNGSGAIQDEWGGYQCQWCAEKEQALNSKGGSDE